ncbi:hypothetical protein BKA93DRAFT_749291 [Sparassis latifolia]
MLSNKNAFAKAAVALVCATAVLAAPQAASPTVDPLCPASYTETLSYTGLIEAPGTTYPYTTTVTITGVEYPIATSTETGIYTFSGVINSGTPGETPVTTVYTASYTEIYTYTNFFDDPPYPTDCFQW